MYYRITRVLTNQKKGSPYDYLPCDEVKLGEINQMDKDRRVCIRLVQSGGLQPFE